jgi:hypothetical protein
VEKTEDLPSWRQFCGSIFCAAIAADSRWIDLAMGLLCQFQSLGHWAALKSALVQARPKPACPFDYSLQIEPKGYAAKTDTI